LRVDKLTPERTAGTSSKKPRQAQFNQIIPRYQQVQSSVTIADTYLDRIID